MRLKNVKFLKCGIRMRPNKHFFLRKKEGEKHSVTNEAVFYSTLHFNRVGVFLFGGGGFSHGGKVWIPMALF